MPAFQIDSDFTLNLLTRLVNINSVNPSLVPDAPGETETAAFVADTLADLGLAVTTHEMEPGRWNVIGRLPGKGGGKSLLLNAHMDTVGVAGMTMDPFAAEMRDGRLYGRGAQDMKGSLAAMIAAAKAIIDGGIELDGNLLVTAVADEEYASIGTADLVKHPEYHADAAIVTEPTDLAICRAHRGFIWFNVDTFGRAAHGSRFNEGVDANMRMGRYLMRLDELEQELRGRPPHPLAGPPSLHAATLRGGQELSVYAARCRLQVERRTIPGETVPQAAAELQAILDALAAEDETFRGEVRPFFHREPFEISENAAIVRAVANAAANHLATPPIHAGQTFWTDAALLAAAGMETVLIGPVGAGLHSAEEWVNVQSVMDLAAVLAETAVSYCNT